MNLKNDIQNKDIQCKSCARVFTSPFLDFSNKTLKSNIKIKVPCLHCKEILYIYKKKDGLHGYAIKSFKQDKTKMHSLSELQHKPISNNSKLTTDVKKTQVVKVKKHRESQKVQLSKTLNLSQNKSNKHPKIKVKNTLLKDKNLDQEVSLSKASENKTQIKPFRLLENSQNKSGQKIELKTKTNIKKPFKFLRHTLILSFVALTVLSIRYYDSIKIKMSFLEPSSSNMQILKQQEKDSNIEKSTVLNEQIKKQDKSEQKMPTDLKTSQQETYTYKNKAMGGTQNNALFTLSDKNRKTTVKHQSSFANTSRYHKKILDLPDMKHLTSSFGIRVDPFSKKMAYHYGIDFRGKIGTPVRAALDGKVKFAGRKGSYGKLIVIKHANGLESKYAHLSKYNVKKGQKIKRGHIIGKIGNTGRSTGPHLHFELLHKGKKVNPLTYKLK